MAYNNNVPLGNQTIASTTDPIRNNFAFIQSAVGEEHNFDPTDATKTYHTKVSMPNLGVPPARPTGTDGLIYLELGELNFLDGANRVSKITAADPNTSGYQWLGRTLLQWGSVNSPPASGNVTFPTTFPTATYNIQLTLRRSTGNQTVTVNSGVAITTSGFSYLSSSGGSDTLFWLAIGA